MRSALARLLALAALAAALLAGCALPPPLGPGPYATHPEPTLSAYPAP